MNSMNNQLLGALVGLSRASESKELSESAGAVLIDGLAMAFPIFYSDPTAEHLEPADQAALRAIPSSSDEVSAMIDRLHKEKNLMAPDCAACQYPCGRTFDYDMEELYGASEALCEAKWNLFASLCKIAVLAPANASKENRQFLSDALFQISCAYEAGQLTEFQKTADTVIRKN